MSIYGIIALNRFGLGARPNEARAVGGDPRGWLNQQIRDNIALPSVFNGLPNSGEARSLFKELQQMRKAAKDDEAARREAGGNIRDLVLAEFTARTTAKITSDMPFYERMVDFWANHFTVSAVKGPVAPLIGAYEREAIRPYVFGRFSDMLKATVLHPAMLIYLDNFNSIGPNSPAIEMLKRRAARNPQAKSPADRGLNENLAREVLELHTLGVNGGYDQQDVTNFAKVLTGWSVPPEAIGGTQRFFPNRHEPGAHKVAGRTFHNEGESQALDVLDYLATHPSTARHIATKLVQHFVSDTPPPDAVRRVEGMFIQSGGDLGQVARALINLDDPWRVAQSKFKRPDEYVISIGRAMNDTDLAGPKALPLLTSLGMKPGSAPSPKGWPDTAMEWAGTLLDTILGEAASGQTRFVIAGADSPAQALTLLFTSPEFLRR